MTKVTTSVQADYIDDKTKLSVLKVCNTSQCGVLESVRLESESLNYVVSNILTIRIWRSLLCSLLLRTE